MTAAIKTSTGVLAANARIRLPVRGSFIYLRSAVDSLNTNADLVVSASLIELGQKTGQTTKVRMSSADKIRPGDEYDSVELLNDGALAVTYELVTGDGDYDRPVPDTVNVAVSVPASTTVSTAPDVTISGVINADKDLIAAANTSRTRLVVTALAANDQILRIGGDDVDADEGIPLAAGESVAIDTQAAIYGVEEVLGTNKVAVFEETL